MCKSFRVGVVFAFALLAGSTLAGVTISSVNRSLAAKACVNAPPDTLNYCESDAISNTVEGPWTAALSFGPGAAGAIGSATAIAQVSQSGLAIIGWIMNLLLIPVVTFYFLRDWDLMILRVRELLPRTVESRVVELARQSDEVLSAFLRGQILVMVALGLIYSIGLWMAGLKLAFLIGMGAGLLSFVPYLGGILGVGGAVIAALVEHRDLIHVVYVLIVFGIGQTLEGFVLTPWLVGDRIGLHPVAVIFAILAGGQLFGFIGVLLALPLAAVLLVILRHVHERYVQSGLYREGVGRGEPGLGTRNSELGNEARPGSEALAAARTSVVAGAAAPAPALSAESRVPSTGSSVPDPSVPASDTQ